MHSAYIRASAIPDGNNAAPVSMQLHQKQPASSCGLIPHDSPRQALNFSLDEMICAVDVANVGAEQTGALLSFMSFFLRSACLNVTEKNADIAPGCVVAMRTHVVALACKNSPAPVLPMIQCCLSEVMLQMLITWKFIQTAVILTD